MSARILVPIAPALVVLGLMAVALVAFAIRVRVLGWPDLPGADRREETAIATRFVQRWVIWMLTPPERWLAAAGVSPNAISLLSLAGCAAAGVAAAFDHFAVAAWCYVGAGMADVLDGRVARRTNRSSTAGALLDSVLDRWGEFFVLGGLALGMRDTLGLLSVLVCIAGSQMVSYTRARGEALGSQLSGGTMQRAERIALLSTGMLACAIAKVTGAYDGHLTLVAVLAVVGLFSTGTSLRRLAKGMNDLRSTPRADAGPRPAPGRESRGPSKPQQVVPAPPAISR